MTAPINKSPVDKRRLALELASLAPQQRSALLDELPVSQQREWLELIETALPLLGTEAAAFEQVMADLETPTRYSEAVLQQRLAGESAAVKRQLIDVFAHGRSELISAHVRDLIDIHLRSGDEELVAPVRVAAPVPWWKRLWS